MTFGPLLLLALSSRLDAISSGVQRTPDASGLLALAAGGLALLLLLLVAARVFETRPAEAVHQPTNIVRDILGHLALSGEERRTLLKLAQLTGLPEPAAMLLSPANFLQAIKRLPTQEDQSQWMRLADPICARLFGVHLPGAPKTAKDNMLEDIQIL